MSLYRIKWNPVVLSFTFPGKQTGSNDALAPYQYRLEPLDVKTLHDYVNGATTHLVASKRNTAKGLQALVNAKPIVTDAFVDAVVAATTPVPNKSDPADPLPSPLETDFEANWPEVVPFLPEESKEPISRPPEAFRPKLERAEIFFGFTFVFLDSSQFNSLQAPINDGHGKALLCDLVPGETTIDQVIEYITNVSGYKDITEIQDSIQEKKGVVVVRMRPRGKWHAWTENFQLRLDVKLGLRSLDQNEFLDVILQNDTSSLRRPLEDGDENESQTVAGTVPKTASEIPTKSPPKTTSVDDDQRNDVRHSRSSPQVQPKVQPSSSADERKEVAEPQEEVKKTFEPASSGPVRRRGRRGIVTSRFTGLDDFDDFQSIKTPAIPEEQEASQSQRPLSARSTRSQIAASQVPESQSQPIVAQKRPLSPSPDPEAAVDELLPAAAAMKRRRLEQGTPALGASKKRTANNNVKQEPTLDKKAKVEDVDYHAMLRSRREAEDEAARQDQEALKQSLAMDGLTLEDMKNLVQVEEMDVPPRSRSLNESNGRGRSGTKSNRQGDERWDGRKNFKGFKRKGDRGDTQQRRQKVFVPMEEVKKKNFGLGEEYWGDSLNRNGSGRSTQSQIQQASSRRERQSRDEDDPNRFRRRKDTARSSGQRNEEDESNEVVDLTQDESLEQNASTRARRRGIVAAEEDNTQHPTQTLRTETQTQKSKGKRPAREEPEHAPQPKRQTRLDSGRQAPPPEDEGDSLKFRFRRRKKD